MTTRLLALIAGCGMLLLPATAQTPTEAIGQNLLQRQQQLEAFQLKGEQFKQQVQPQLTPQQRSEASRRHLIQQQNQQALHDRQVQQQSVLGQGSRELPPTDQAKRLEQQSLQFQRERETQLSDFERQNRESQRKKDAEAGR